jgi:hypothetical protein
VIGTLHKWFWLPGRYLTLDKVLQVAAFVYRTFNAILFALDVTVLHKDKDHHVQKVCSFHCNNINLLRGRLDYSVAFIPPISAYIATFLWCFNKLFAKRKYCQTDWSQVYSWLEECYKCSWNYYLNDTLIGVIECNVVQFIRAMATMWHSMCSDGGRMVY